MITQETFQAARCSLFRVIVFNEFEAQHADFEPYVYLLLAVLRKRLVFSELKVIQLLMRSQ